MELRNGSREVVQEIERIACNPTLFIKEWKEQPILMRIRKIVSLNLYVSTKLLHYFLYYLNNTFWDVVNYKKCYIKFQFEHDDSVVLLPFNWTLGYTKFRRLIEKFDVLISDTKDVVLAEDPHLARYMKTLAVEVDDIIEERLPSMQNDWR